MSKEAFLVELKKFAEDFAKYIFAFLLLCILLLFSIGMLSSAYHGYDIFWHLWSGRQIVDSGAVANTDPIAFTTDGARWINISWLAQVVFYTSYQSLGYHGPILISGLLAASALGLFLLTLRSSKCGAISTLLFTLLFAAGFSLCAGLRPRMFTFALLALLGYLLRPADRDRPLSALSTALLIPVMLVWNNLHGGVIFGYLVLGVDALISAGDWAAKRHDYAKQRTLQLLSVIGIGFLGFALHPHGFEALIHIGTYAAEVDQIYFEEIVDGRAPQLDGVTGKLLLLNLVLFMFAIVQSWSRVSLRDLLLVFCFFTLSLSFARILTPFAIVCYPLGALWYSRLLEDAAGGAFSWVASLEEQCRKFIRFLIVLLPLICVIWVLLLFNKTTEQLVSSAPPKVCIDPRTTVYPVKALEHLKSSELDGRIFNLYAFGGFIGWHLYPERRIFIDGRSDLHSVNDTYDDHMAIASMKPGWRSLLDDYKIDLILMEYEAPLVHELVRTENWKIVFEDGVFILAKRP